MSPSSQSAAILEPAYAYADGDTGFAALVDAYARPAHDAGSSYLHGASITDGDLADLADADGTDAGMTGAGMTDADTRATSTHAPAWAADATAWELGEADRVHYWSTDDEEPESWKDRALCAQTDPEAFFPEKGGSTREGKRVCQSCPVKAECLDFALANDERFGIWGGLSERERRRLRRHGA